MCKQNMDMMGCPGLTEKVGSGLFFIFSDSVCMGKGNRRKIFFFDVEDLHNFY